jgi:hypothetical protein
MGEQATASLCDMMPGPADRWPTGDPPDFHEPPYWPVMMIHVRGFRKHPDRGR